MSVRILLMYLLHLNNILDIKAFEQLIHTSLASKFYFKRKMECLCAKVNYQ